MAVVSIENETVGSSNQCAPVTKTRAFENVPDNFGYVAPKKSTGNTREWVGFKQYQQQY